MFCTLWSRKMMIFGGKKDEWAECEDMKHKKSLYLNFEKIIGYK